MSLSNRWLSLHGLSFDLVRLFRLLSPDYDIRGLARQVRSPQVAQDGERTKRVEPEARATKDESHPTAGARLFALLAVVKEDLEAIAE